MNRSNVMVHTVTRIVVFIILSFSIFMFFAGHNHPGGGFISGLMTAAALLLMYVSFDISTVKSILPFRYAHMIAVGLLLAVGSGLIGILAGDPFLVQYYDDFWIPIVGETELNTALIFDLGVYLTVVGMGLLIILSIARDDS